MEAATDHYVPHDALSICFSPTSHLGELALDFFSYCFFFAAQTGSYNVFRTSTYIYRLYTSQLFVDSASLANAMCHLISVCLSCHLTLAPLCCSCLFSMLDESFHFSSYIYKIFKSTKAPRDQTNFTLSTSPYFTLPLNLSVRLPC